MRRFRWLLPVAIIAILGAVGVVYFRRLAALSGNSPARPALLDSGIQGSAQDWCFEQAQGANPHVEICAAKMLRTGETIELQGVKLKLFHDGASEFDLVGSDFAQFDLTERKLFSQGNVEITLGVPVNGPTPGRLLKIHSSGVEFSSETGDAATPRPVRFEFDRGSGSSVGAHYNPATRELRMDSQVWLEWRGKTPETPPMHIEAGEAFYLENQSKVVLKPWARLTRGGLRMDGAWTEVLLENGDIKRADANDGRGVQESPGRKVEFGAKELHILFDEHMRVNYVLAEPQASLISTAATSRTSVAANRLDLNFETANKDSLLSKASASGSSSVTAEPISRPGAAPAETRVLKSEVIHLLMRPGGEEIERVETAGPGTLDFLPNRPDQSKRNLSGDMIWIYYGPQNRIDHLRSTGVTTRTELNLPRITHSDELLAYFDGQSALTRLEQNNNFRYEEGDRRANSRRATFEPARDLLTLDGSASTSDPSGKVNADRIMLDQKTGDYIAEGNVSTTRQPTRKGGAASSSAMMSSSEVMQATARRMTSTEKNEKIRYEGDAKAWQGANRVNADRLDIDQQRHILEAHGKVETQFVDKNSKSGPATFTIVRAQDLEYSTETRVAHYTGGVHLERPGLTVDSRELRAFLKDGNSDASLDKALADGAVRTVLVTVVPGKPKRTRTGMSEHAEYYAGDQKVILNGGLVRADDTEAGRSEGAQLTWQANNDSLRMDSEPAKQVRTVIPKK